jgi:hypothetical protein
MPVGRRVLQHRVASAIAAAASESSGGGGGGGASSHADRSGGLDYCWLWMTTDVVVVEVPGGIDCHLPHHRYCGLRRTSCPRRHATRPLPRPPSPSLKRPADAKRPLVAQHHVVAGDAEPTATTNVSDNASLRWTTLLHALQVVTAVVVVGVVTVVDDSMRRSSVAREPDADDFDAPRDHHESFVREAASLLLLEWMREAGSQRREIELSRRRLNRREVEHALAAAGCRLHRQSSLADGDARLVECDDVHLEILMMDSCPLTHYAALSKICYPRHHRMLRMDVVRLLRQRQMILSVAVPVAVLRASNASASIHQWMSHHKRRRRHHYRHRSPADEPQSRGQSAAAVDKLRVLSQGHCTFRLDRQHGRDDGQLSDVAAVASPASCVVLPEIALRDVGGQQRRVTSLGSLSPCPRSQRGVLASAGRPVGWRCAKM